MSNFDKRKSYKQDVSDNVLANMSYGDLKRIARRMNILTTNKTRTDLIRSIKSARNAKATINLPDTQQVLTSQVYNQRFPPIQRQPQQNSFQVQQPQGQMGLLCPPVGYHQAPMNVPLLQTIPKMQCMPYNIPPAQCMVQTPMKPIGFSEQPPLGAGQFTTRWPPVHYQQASQYSPPFQTSSNSLLGQYPNLSAQGYFHQTPVKGAWIMKNSSLSQQSPLTCGTNVRPTGMIFNCPIINCDVPLPLFELAGHIKRIHSENIGLYFEWETRFIVRNFYEHNKMLHIQNINNRIILTLMDFVNGFLHVAVRYLPDGCRDRTTAIVHFKKQNDVVCKWEGLVPSYEELISKNYCMVLNLRYCGEREQLSIKSIIL